MLSAAAGKIGDIVGETRTLLGRSAQLAERTAGVSEDVQSGVTEVVAQMHELESLTRTSAASLDEIAQTTRSLRQTAGRARELLG